MPYEIGISLTKFVMEEQMQHPAATGEFSELLSELIFCAKIISREVNKAGLVEILGLTGKRNVQGEDVQKLDEFANETIIKSMSPTGHLCVMASEENDEPISIPDEYLKGNYILLFDPLDGSSNIDANAPIGTIFSILRRRSEGEGECREDLLQPGKDQACAGYFLYGPSTMMVYTTGRGTHGFTLDPSVGEFLLSHPDMKVPEKGKYYSVNEGNYGNWRTGVKKFVDFLKSPTEERKSYGTRYIGSLVADFHRTLLYGGIFMYPADHRDPEKPKGKLRLLYELNPMSFIIEQAGGASSTGTGRLMEVVPETLHQREPVFLGSATEVGWADEFIAGDGS